jgi:hypothetical protein
LSSSHCQLVSRNATGLDVEGGCINSFGRKVAMNERWLRETLRIREFMISREGKALIVIGVTGMVRELRNERLLNITAI